MKGLFFSGDRKMIGITANKDSHKIRERERERKEIGAPLYNNAFEHFNV